MERNNMIQDELLRKFVQSSKTFKWTPRSDQKVIMMPLASLFKDIINNEHQSNAPCAGIVSSPTGATVKKLPSNSHHIKFSPLSSLPNQNTSASGANLEVLPNKLPLKRRGRNPKGKIKNTEKLQNVLALPAEEIDFDSTGATVKWLPSNSHHIKFSPLSSLPNQNTSASGANLEVLPDKLPLQLNRRGPNPKGKIKNTEKLQNVLALPAEEIDFDSIVPRIQNVTARVNLSCKIDLNIVKLHGNTYYNPKAFSAATMKLLNPKSTALIFPNGILVCTGTNSIETSRKASRGYAYLLKKMGCDVKFRNFEINNLVAGYHLPFKINLPKLKQTLKANRIYCNYIPEVFPGLKYETGIGKICGKIFTTGNVVITGAKNIDDIKRAFQKVYPDIYAHREEILQVDDSSCSK